MFDYLYENDVKSMQTITIPKRLFSDPTYITLSAQAKVLYALLLDGCENQDSTNRPYTHFSIHEICDDLCCSSFEAISLLTELTDFGLIFCEEKKVYVNDYEKLEV